MTSHFCLPLTFLIPKNKKFQIILIILICHHQRIGQKSTAFMQNIYVCVYT